MLETIQRMNNHNLQVLVNIIGAVESGGQVYGQRRYNQYSPPYHSTPKEHTITIGWYCAYGHEAHTLIQAIYDADPISFMRLDNADIEEMLRYDWEGIKWKPTAKEKASIIALIDSPVGHKVQDEIFIDKMKQLINDCATDYTTDIKAQMMYCEIRHLGGKKAVKRIFDRCKGDYSLDNIMVALVADQKDTSSSNQVGDKLFWSRHVKCKQFITEYAEVEDQAVVKKITEKDIILCGHGSANPRTIRMDTYLSQRYSQTASATVNGKKYTWNKGVVAVVRLKNISDTLRKRYVSTYATILGRNIYSQTRRLYCYTKYKDGKYYSDCSSSQCLTFKQIGVNISALNTVGMYDSSLFEKVDVTIKNGHIMNPEVLRVGDQLLFAGSDYYRKLHIGHVEGIYSINGAEQQETDGVAGFQTWLNTYYAEICEKYTGSLLVIDGIFGDKTRRAAITVWKYMMNKYYSEKLTLGNYNFFDSCKKAAQKITYDELTKHGTLTAILQGLLAKNSAYNGAITAKVSDALKAAVKSYNTQHNIKNTDICADTWYSLFNS